MKRSIIVIASITTALAASGCVRTVTSVATAPFRAAGQVVDWTTTSQEEADRNYGRKMRKQEAREGRERRERDKRCRREPERCYE